MIQHGDIRWFRFRAPDKRRPVLVVVRPALLPSLSLVPVIPISTQIRGMPHEVLFDETDAQKTVPSPRDLNDSALDHIPSGGVWAA